MHTDLGARVQLLESLFNKIVQSNTTVLENPITQYAINCGRLLWPLYHLNSSVTSPSIGTQPNQFQRFSHFVFSLVALRQTIRVIRLKITCQATNKSKMAQLDIRCHQITLSFCIKCVLTLDQWLMSLFNQKVSFSPIQYWQYFSPGESEVFQHFLGLTKQWFALKVKMTKDKHEF